MIYHKRTYTPESYEGDGSLSVGFRGASVRVSAFVSDNRIYLTYTTYTR